VRGRHTASAFDRSIIRSGQITVPLGWAISTRQATVLHRAARDPSVLGPAGSSQHGSPPPALLRVCPSDARAGRPL